MQTVTEFADFQSERAELPHTAVAFALTEAEVVDELPTNLADDADAPNDPASQLLDRAVAGDRGAFDELLTNLRPRAMAAAMKVLRSHDDAEDAVQDAFVKIWRNLSAFEGRSSFSTWIHRIVTNTSLDLLRKNASRSESTDHTEKEDGTSVSLEPVSETTPETELGGIELQSLVRLAVAKLPGPHRQAVELREFEDCSYQEIAEIIQCPVGTVMSRLHHARHRLADDLRAPLGESFGLCAA